MALDVSESGSGSILSIPEIMSKASQLFFGEGMKPFAAAGWDNIAFVGELPVVTRGDIDRFVRATASPEAYKSLERSTELNYSITTEDSSYRCCYVTKGKASLVIRRVPRAS